MLPGIERKVLVHAYDRKKTGKVANQEVASADKKSVHKIISK